MSRPEAGAQQGPWSVSNAVCGGGEVGRTGQGEVPTAPDVDAAGAALQPVGCPSRAGFRGARVRGTRESRAQLRPYGAHHAVGRGTRLHIQERIDRDGGEGEGAQIVPDNVNECQMLGPVLLTGR